MLANVDGANLGALNESPSQKEGKTVTRACTRPTYLPLNESPSQKEGKTFGKTVWYLSKLVGLNESPSQKEGKTCGRASAAHQFLRRLNESPSQKEGKTRAILAV